MNKIVLSAMAAAIVLVGAAFGVVGESGPARGQEYGLEGNAGQGRRVFVLKSCVECHAVMGSGGKLGPDLAEVGKGRSFHRLAAKMWEHIPLMIESFTEEGLDWPTLSPDQMGDLVAYLFYLNYFDRPGDYAKGKQSFQDKRCASCHNVGGTGGSLAPALDDYAASASPLMMVTAMWNHGPAMVKKLQAQGIAIPKFEGSEIADILAYLQGATLSPRSQKNYLKPGDPRRGQVAFREKQCGLCHPVRGEGAGDGPDLAESTLNRGVSAIAGILWNHGPMMWEKMTDKGIAIQPFVVQEMTDLLAYLYFIGYYPPDGKWKNGRRLFKARGCVNCHAEQSDEDDEAPGLDEIIPLDHPVRLASALWNHGPMVFEEASAEMTPWPSFSEKEMRDLCAYLEGRGEEDESGDD